MSDVSQAQMSEGLITNEALAEWKKRIGISLRIGNIFNRFIY